MLCGFVVRGIDPLACDARFCLLTRGFPQRVVASGGKKCLKNVNDHSLNILSER